MTGSGVEREDPGTQKTSRSLLWIAMGESDRASSRLRVHAWKPFLEEAGIRVDVLAYHASGGGQGEGWLRRLSPRISAGLAAPRLWGEIERRARGVEWVVFQEVLPPARALERIAATGARIGFDFSDPVHLANGPSHRTYHRVIHRLSTLPRFRAMVRRAEWSTIENDLLEPLVLQLGGAPVVMRGPVDTDRYAPGERSGRERARIGWAGSNGTLPLMRPVLALLADLARQGLEFDLQLFGVSNAVAVPGVHTEVIPWSLDAEPEVIGLFDIGLNHMPMTAWTRYRGGAKLIFYHACGVPTVTSASGIGDQVVEHEETGLIVATPEEWREALTRLVRDADLRQRLGAKARAVAVSKYSYRAYLPVVMELLV